MIMIMCLIYTYILYLFDSSTSYTVGQGRQAIVYNENWDDDLASSSQANDEENWDNECVGTYNPVLATENKMVIRPSYAVAKMSKAAKKAFRMAERARLYGLVSKNYKDESEKYSEMNKKK